MSRLSIFSQNNAPILLGKQTVRFAPECLAYVKEHGSFPENKGGRQAGRDDYLHLQFVFSNGATTCSWKEDRQEHNPRYTDTIRLYFDGNRPNDGFLMKLTYEQMQKRDKRYKTMTLEEIFGDLIDQGEFTVWFYRYQGKYLQVAWNAEQYKKATGGETKKTTAKKVEVVEEELPFDLD